MAYFLVQAAYTPESWKAQIRDQPNIEDRLRPSIQNLGGRIDSIYYAFGDHDVIAIVEFPSNDAAAAFSLMASAGGAVKTVKTTPLMTVSEGLQAMGKASSAASLYKAPVGEGAKV